MQEQQGPLIEQKSGKGLAEARLTPFGVSRGGEFLIFEMNFNLMLIGGAFLTSLLIMVVIGTLAARRAEASPDDYLLAGRSLPPWLAAFSSAATNNSGYMFIGLVGFAYQRGMEAVWLQMGWLAGDVFAWFMVHERARRSTGKGGFLSVPSWLGTDDRGKTSRGIVVTSSVLTFVFLAGYAAAQLKAGSTGLVAFFLWDPSTGIILSALVVVLYCFAGGFRASVWTDAAQSLVMFLAMSLLVASAWQEVGGGAELVRNLTAQDPNLVALFPFSGAFSFGLFVFGYFWGGFLAVAQPHILTRTMALRSLDEFGAARRYYFLWVVPFSCLTLLSGLLARALLSDLPEQLSPAGVAFTAEQSLPVLSSLVLPEVLVGVVLAGIFAATMSTADSQVLTCSAALTQDLLPRFKSSHLASKVATLSVTALALVIALSASEGVFAMVLMAWSVLGSSLGPLVILRIFGRVPRGEVAVTMMLVSAATAFLWKRAAADSGVYEVIPGVASAFLVLGLSSLVDRFRAELVTRSGAS